MREEIIELIKVAEDIVSNFEKDIFINDRGFYMNAKSLVDDMIEQIMVIKKTVELQDYTDEIYNANKDDLNFIIDTINQIGELLKTKTIHIIVEGKGNYRVKVLGEKEIAIDTAENNITEINETPNNDEDKIVEEQAITTDDLIDEAAMDDFLDNN